MRPAPRPPRSPVSACPRHDVAARSLLTPGCGTGRLAEARERLVASALAGAADGTRGALRAAAAQRQAAATPP